MISTEELSRLLAILYAAPLEPDKWQVFFDHLSQLTQISSGYLMVDDKSHGHMALAGGGSTYDPETVRVYNEYYVQVDPFVVPTLQNPRVEVIQGEELVSRHQLLKSEFYSDVLHRNDMEYMTLLSCSIAEHTDVMPLWRRKQDGPMDEVSIALLKILLPHVQIALRTRRSLQGANVQNQFAELALEAIAAAALLVSATGNVLHMNKLATDLIHKGDGLRLEGVSLTAWSMKERVRLSLFIAGAASASRNGTPTVPGGALEISRRGSQHPLLVTVLPVPESSRSIVGIPCALVFVSDPSAPQKSRADLMRTLYGLTPTESRLADLLSEGLEVRGIADRLGITIETARFHLKKVLAKTGAHRQTELIRLMLSLPAQ